MTLWPDFRAEPTNSVQILAAQPSWKSGHYWMQMARTWFVNNSIIQKALIMGSGLREQAHVKNYCYNHHHFLQHWEILERSLLTRTLISCQVKLHCEALMVWKLGWGRLHKFFWKPGTWTRQDEKCTGFLSLLQIMNTVMHCNVTVIVMSSL